jgi:tetratricopeptide (TPR) repeat protein
MKNVLLCFTMLICFSTSSKAQVDQTKLLELIESQRFNDLANYLESVYPNGTDDPKILTRLGYAYYMSGNLPKAETNYLQLLKKDSTNFSTLNSLANVANKRGNYKQVIDYYKRILAIDSTNFYTTKQAAFAYAQVDDIDQEFKYLKKANTLNPLDADVAYDYGLRLITRLEVVKADLVFRTALTADSTNIILLKGILSINYINDNYKEVVSIGEKLIALGDGSNETKNKIGIAYYYVKEYSKCIEMMMALETAKVATETSYYFTALSYRKLNQLEKSNNFMNAAISASISDNIKIYYQELAVNRESLNQFKTSLFNYKKALEYNGKNTINYSIARIYDADLKQPKTALPYYKTYLKKANKLDKDDLPYIQYAEARVKEIEG